MARVNEQPSRPGTAIGVKLVLSWLLVGVPLLWGVANTIRDATKLFG